MRSLPQNLQTELAGGAVDANYLVYLIDLDAALPRSWTNADADIYFEGKQYHARGMDFGSAECNISPVVDKIRVDIDNTDLALAVLLQTEELRGRRFLLRLAALDASMQVIGTVTHFDGLFDSAQARRDKVRIDVYNHLILWKKLAPRRAHSATCPWTFRDADTCRYAGTGVRCDKSWEQCTAYANTLHFGGFRWLPSLVDKQIWFGRQPR